MTTYRAELLDAVGKVITSTDTRAWNSAIRASEALVRDHARSRGAIFEGRPAEVDHVDGTAHDQRVCGYDCTERRYERRWSSDPEGFGIMRLVSTRISAVVSA